MGPAHLRSPEKLKFLLCPIIAQGRAEQERFYELFDQYWRQVEQPWEMPPLPATPKWWETLPEWLRWALPLLLVLGMGYGIGRLIIKENPPELKVAFDHPPVVSIGDTIHFKNLSEHIDSSALRWEIVNPANDSIEFVDTQSFDLHYLVKYAGEEPTREVRLTSLHSLDPKTGQPATHQSSFSIRCNFPPSFISHTAPNEAAVGEEVKFSVRLADSADVEVEWDFGDETKTEAATKDRYDKKVNNSSRTKQPPVLPKEKTRITGQSATHIFTKKGLFEVRAVATRSGLEGECSVADTWRISIGREDAFLAAKPLIRDTLDPTISFSWGTWILLGLLGLAMIWYWVKWAVRKPPPPPTEGEDLTAAAERFRSVDKAPYFIPFRPQEGNIRVDRELYRLADVLRQRQEGLRKTFDVPVSVKKTIDGGGFPSLVTRTDTVPTEYLFLVDEQTQQSHQRRLSGFIVQFLQQREVLGEVYYFNSSLHSFWNEQHPGGISPEQLRRLHPYHRLVLLGDGHALLDPAATGKPALRQEATSLLSQWKNRLLLTPMPVVSWTYREGVLHSLFAIFPSDTEGLGEAMKHIERGIPDDERPTYATWCEHLLEGRHETDINYRRWRSAADHRDYLKDHPALYLWLCALAVYPKPDWSITLAIGRALAPLGVDLNYDNLLLISRIPWLVSGDLSPRLRKELLADLDPEAERLAREAVQAELKAVETLVQGSQVNQEHQINLALQNFALAPEVPEAQTAIRQLLGMNLLTPRHIADLDTTIERYQSPGVGAPSTVSRQPPTIHQFLEENRAKPPSQQKPFFNKDFWRATAATLLYLLIFLFAWTTKSETLARWLDVDMASSARCEEQFLAAGFLKKECYADSARIYNNLGVDTYLNMDGDLTEKTVLILRQANEIKVNQAFGYFEKALKYKPDYPMAFFNRLSLRYNLGVQEYNAYVSDSSSIEGLRKSMARFRSVLVGLDTLAKITKEPDGWSSALKMSLDALHGLGLAYYYLGVSPGYEAAPSPYSSLLTQLLEEKDEQKKLELAQRLKGAQSSSPQDSSMILYSAIILSDSTYFDSLETYPHLQSLLFKQLGAGQQLVSLLTVDSISGKPIDRVLVTADNYQRQTNPQGQAQVEMTVGERRVFEFNKKGYLTVRREIRPGSGNLTFTVQMKPEVPNPPALVSNTSVIYFDVDKTILRPDAQRALDAVANILLKNPTWQLEITGHTDNNGTSAYNLQLSQRMADAVAKYLLKKGIKPDRLSIFGKGETQPAVPNTTDRNRLANRRVALRLIKPEDGTSNPAADDDGDGVPNQNDKCPQEPGDPSNGGCPANDQNPNQQPPADFSVPEMVFVKGGTFRMGCDDKLDSDCQPDEKPVHDVTLDDFYMGKYEVTNEEFAAFLNDYGGPSANSSLYNGEVMIEEHERGIGIRNEKGKITCYAQKGYEKHPVVKVTWIGASEYCQWLSQKTGKKYRLPTEAEWEYAARGGNTSSMTKYSGSNDLSEVGWHLDNAGGQSHPVGKKKPNGLGVFDMSGNVWEWCVDWYNEKYYQQFEKGGSRNPAGPSSGAERVLRGGAWSTVYYGCRVADRVSGIPNKGNDSNGFRVAREP
ncbi:MAG: SUMF1/EgtB/PvdO family nonheme iron enzyme [Saprospiraceae bacterium]|nr:SUMF1/EgtB/PvdO family nonheme iron enzyme [Saprospiraceae bacterium]